MGRWAIHKDNRNMNEDMVISKAGLDLIKKHEGFRNHPYLCPAGVPTIGYGTTFYPDGTKVTMDDPPVTQLKATEYLLEVVEQFEQGVKSVVTSDITQNQFDALVSFAYNLGMANLRRSTLLKKVNENPNDPSIKDEFLRWINANGKPLKGLKKRRNMEAWVYFEHIRDEVYPENA